MGLNLLSLTWCLGSLVFDYSMVFYHLLMLCLVFFLVFKVLQQGNHLREMDRFFDTFLSHSVNLKNGFCLKHASEVCFLKNSGCRRKETADCPHSGSRNSGRIGEEEESAAEEDERNREKDGEDCMDRQEDDIMWLKNQLQIEQTCRHSLALELEKEKMAATSSINEMLVKIERLENEKHLKEMEVRQYQRIAETEEACKKEVIQDLRCIILRHEWERNILQINAEEGAQKNVVRRNPCYEAIGHPEQYHDDARNQFKEMN